MDEEEKRVSDAAFTQSMGPAVEEQSVATGFGAPTQSTASDAAFNQLDGVPEVAPLEYDPAPVDGLSPELQTAFQQNWDDALKTASDAVRGLTVDAGEGDEFAQYTQSLLELANEPAPQAKPATSGVAVATEPVSIVASVQRGIIQEFGEDPFEMI